MILPHPESDLTLNIMVLGHDIIVELKKNKNKGFVLVENLLGKFLKKTPKRTPAMFLDTLTFLYSCGMIEKRGYKVKLVTRKAEQISLFQ